VYLPRLLRPTFNLARSRFPVVLITGPRQSGKTTFLRHRLPASWRYASFDDPLRRAFAREDPRGFLDAGGDGPLVLDEIQYVPTLLPYIKLSVDADRSRCGAYLLTGSQQFALMQGVSESLAGRVAVLDLPPLSLLELAPSGARDLATAIWCGGYPDPALHPETRDLWTNSYLRTYVERDVRQVRDIQDLQGFEQVLGLAAAAHGQELSKARLSRAAGVSQPTIRAWLSVLAASYVVTLLPPWHRNLGKRLVKSSKLFFRDPALVCALTRQPSGEAALAGPMGGALLEGLVVSEAHKLFAAAGKSPACWFWRSHDGLEVDLLVELDGQVVPVEVKLTATPKTGHVAPIRRLRALVGEAECHPGLLVCRVQEPVALPGGVTALPWRAWPRWLADHLGIRPRA